MSSRSTAARIAALSLHAAGGTNTGPARRAFAERFLNEVDPGHVLGEAERERRAAIARRLYFTRLAAKSAAVRRRMSPPSAGPGRGRHDVLDRFASVSVALGGQAPRAPRRRPDARRRPATGGPEE